MRVRGILMVAAVALAGCGNGGRTNKSATSGSTSTTPGGTTTSGTTSGTPSGTTSPTSVGSPYWYVDDKLGNPLRPHTPDEAKLAAEVLDLVNKERTSRSLQPLGLDVGAQKPAKAHADDMAGRSYFSHVTPEGWTLADRLAMTGVSGHTGAGENIARGMTTAQAAVDAWMNSPGHRANILDPDFTGLGVGIRLDARQWVQVFLRR